MKNIMQCRSETERLHNEEFTFVFEYIVYKYADRYSVLPFLQAQAEKDYAVEGDPEKSRRQIMRTHGRRDVFPLGFTKRPHAYAERIHARICSERGGWGFALCC